MERAKTWKEWRTREIMNIGMGEYDTAREFKVLLDHAYEMGAKNEAERAVTLYQKALGDTKLPEEVWKKLARVNAQLLPDTKK